MSVRLCFFGDEVKPAAILTVPSPSPLSVTTSPLQVPGLFYWNVFLVPSRFFSLFFLRKNKDSFAEFRRLGTASSVGCVWPQPVVPCLGGKVGLADSPVPLRRLIALVRFLSLILAPNRSIRSRNPPCALPATPTPRVGANNDPPSTPP